MKLQLSVVTSVLAVIASFGLALGTAQASVTLTTNSATPTVDADDQYNLSYNGPYPAPLVWPMNSSSISTDHATGQTFTTGSSGQFTLNSFSMKGYGYYATGGDSLFNSWQTWSIRIGTISGTTVTPLLEVGGIPTVEESTTNGGTNWFTWTFSGSDILTLDANTTYAIQVLGSSGWLQFDGVPNDTAYTGGNAIINTNNTWSLSTTSTTVENWGFDHTFAVGLNAVPEPSTYAFLFAGSILLLAMRLRRRPVRA